MKTSGQIAFEAYNESRGGVNYQGNKTPPWEELPSVIQEAWRAAADAVLTKSSATQAIRDAKDRA